MQRSFSDLFLSPFLLSTLENQGFTQPTRIQTMAIPTILQGRDVCACAQTGSGKTAAFLLPLIDQLMHGRKRSGLPRAIVLSPTRELAQQVRDNVTLFTQNTHLTSALLVGGEWAGEQEKQLRKRPDIVIATPGRLLDLIERGKLLLMDVKSLIIDEADRMLDMGFMPDIERLLDALPSSKQTVLFSATFPKELNAHIQSLLTHPKYIEAASSSMPLASIQQYRVDVSDKTKRTSLRDVVRKHDGQAAIVFCNTKRDVDIVARSLNVHGFPSMPIHGDLSQSVRNETLEMFRANQDKGLILVASDVAARGIDIDNLPLVINFDLPINAEDYIHRIGRTGRAGKAGTAFSLIGAQDQKRLPAILKIMHMEAMDYSPLFPKQVPQPQSTQALETSSQPRPNLQKASKEHKKRIEKREDHIQKGFGDHVPAFMRFDPQTYFDGSAFLHDAAQEKSQKTIQSTDQVKETNRTQSVQDALNTLGVQSVPPSHDSVSHSLDAPFEDVTAPTALKDKKKRRSRKKAPVEREHTSEMSQNDGNNTHQLFDTHTDNVPTENISAVPLHMPSDSLPALSNSASKDEQELSLETKTVKTDFDTPKKSQDHEDFAQKQPRRLTKKSAKVSEKIDAAHLRVETHNIAQDAMALMALNETDAASARTSFLYAALNRQKDQKMQQNSDDIVGAVTTDHTENSQEPSLDTKKTPPRKKKRVKNSKESALNAGISKKSSANALSKKGVQQENLEMSLAVNQGDQSAQDNATRTPAEDQSTQGNETRIPVKITPIEPSVQDSIATTQKVQSNPKKKTSVRRKKSTHSKDAAQVLEASARHDAPLEDETPKRNAKVSS